VLQGQQDASQRPQQSFFRQQAQTQKPAQGQEQQPFSGAGARSASQYAQPSSTNSAQNTPTSTTSSMTMPPSTYQNYNTDQAYLNMQYAMSANRAVQVSPRGYGSSSGGENQLGGPMTQPEVPGRMYNSFGRRWQLKPNRCSHNYTVCVSRWISHNKKLGRIRSKKEIKKRWFDDACKAFGALQLDQCMQKEITLANGEQGFHHAGTPFLRHHKPILGGDGEKRDCQYFEI
jgi:hypothetical protein